MAKSTKTRNVASEPDAPAFNGAEGRDDASWPSYTESGAGLADFESFEDDPMCAPFERAPPQPFSLGREVRRHPLIYIGVGALIVTGVAVYLGRGILGRNARTATVKLVRPVVVRAAARRPLKTARFAARHPKLAARIVELVR